MFTYIFFCFFYKNFSNHEIHKEYKNSRRLYPKLHTIEWKIMSNIAVAKVAYVAKEVYCQSLKEFLHWLGWGMWRGDYVL